MKETERQKEKQQQKNPEKTKTNSRDQITPPQKKEITPDWIEKAEGNQSLSEREVSMKVGEVKDDFDIINGHKRK